MGLVGMRGFNFPALSQFVQEGRRDMSQNGMHGKSLCFQCVLDVGILQIDCFRSVHLIFEHVSSA